MFSSRRAAQLFLVAAALAAVGTAVLTAQRDQTSEAVQGAAGLAASGDAPAGRIEGPAILEGDSVPDFIISPGSQSIATRILDGATGAELGAGYPFGPGFGGGVRMAAGDLSGDGVADLVMGMGPGGGLVSLLNGATLAPIGAGYPFGPAFAGGVSVAVGDVNGDGSNDIVTGQASSGGAVTVFNGLNYSVVLAVTPFGPSYTGGVNVATGDVDGDGRADLIVGQATGGVVAIVSAATGAVTVSGAPYGAVNGVFVAAGDVDGDGRADVVAAPGSGGGPVLVYDINSLTVLAALTPYPTGFAGGIRVAATDVTGDGRAEILTVPGPGIAPTLLVFDGATFAVIRSYAAFPVSFTGGALIAAPAFAGVRFTTPAAATVVVGTPASVPIRAVGSPPVTTLTMSGTLPAGLTFTDNGGGSGTLAGTPATGTGGSYALTLTAASGPTQRTQAFTLTVNEAPAVTSAAAATFDVGTASTFTITSTGFPAATVALGGALPTGVTFAAGAAGTGTLSGTPASGTTGTYPLTVTASNGVGATATQNFVLTVQVVPIITSANATTFTTGSAATFTVTTSASPAVTAVTASGALPSGVTFTDNGNGTATLAGTPGAGTGGSYPLTLSAVNSAGTGTQSFTLTVQQPAAITSGASATFQAGTPGSFAVTSTGFPAPTLTVTGTLPAGVTFVDNGGGAGTLAGTPSPGSGGPYPITLQATNGVGAQATQSFMLTVNEQATFTGAASIAFTTATPGSFTVTTSGYPAPAISLTGSLPTGVTFTNNGNGTATLAGTPAAATGGAYALTLGATNGIGPAASQNFVLTVQQAPAITSASATSFTEDVSGTFSVTTTGFPNATVSATGALPTGVTLTPNTDGTATLAGTPAAGTQGSYPLAISASNGVGSPAAQSFTLTVACPVITLAPAAGALPAGNYNAAYSQTFTATGGSGHTFAVTAGSLPAGLTLGSGGGLTGTPTATGTFNFTVTATATGGCPGQAAYSLSLTPDAQNESFSNAVGNTQLSVGAGTPATPAVVLSGSVLTNDQGPGALMAGPASIATTNGGQVALSTNGTFLYTPPPGFAGPSDTFTYTLTDGNGVTDTAVVTVNMGGVVWYVNGTAGAGDGRSQSPFNTMNAAAAAAQAGQVIYVHPGSPAGATVLKANQTLQGAGETFVLNGLTIAAGAAPVLQDTITLANAVAVRALTVDAGPNAAVSGAALTGVESLTGVAITGGSTGLSLTGLAGTFSATGGAISGITPGAAVVISGGTGTITIGSSISSISGRSVDVQGRMAGAVTFSGAITDTGTGVRVVNNAGSSIAFTGGLALDTGVNDAFTATSGGTITATQDNASIVNTITTTDGTALLVVNTEIGSAGLTFRSISAGTSTPSPGNGIVLDNTGTGVSNGGLTVQGNGTVTTDSGGTIQRKTGADGSTTSGNGIYLNSTKSPAFHRMHLFDFDNSAILGFNVLGFALADSTIDGTSGTSAAEVEGPIVFGAPSPSGINGLLGAGSISNSSILGGVEHGIELYNQSGTMSLQMSGTSPVVCVVGDNSATTGGDGLHLLSEGTANATVTIDTCRFRDNRAVGTRGLVTDDASLTFTITDSQWVRGGEGVLLSNGGNAQLTATVTTGYFTDVPGRHVEVGQVPFDATAASMLRATVTGNVAYQANTVVPTAHAYGARLSSTVGQISSARLLFDSNYIEGAGTLNQLVLETPDANTTPAVDVTVTNNRTDVMDATTGLHGIVIDGSSSGAATNICAAVTNNLVLYPPDDTNYPPTAVNSIVLTQGGGTTVRLERGGEVLAAPASTVLQNNNNIGPVNSLPTAVNGAVLVIENNSCLLPNAP